MVMILTDPVLLADPDAFAGELGEQLLGNGWGYLLACLAGGILLLLWKKKDFCFRTLWIPGKPMTAGAFFGMLCVFMSGQAVFQLLVPVMEWLFNLIGLSVMDALESATMQVDTLSMFLYMGVFAPVFEEILFRGLVLRTLEPYGKKFAIVGSAFLFGMFHGNVVQTPFAFLVGLVLGYAAVEYNIGWAMLLHMINNLVLGDMIQRLDAMLGGGIVVGLLGLAIICCGIGSIVMLCVRKQEIRNYEFWNRIDGKCVRALLFNAGSLVLMALLALNMITLILPAN
jgi:membrane protease YdiL (CAAX protease family)